MADSGSFVDLLKPVLDTYMDAAVGIVGCRSRGLARESCEYDVLVVLPESHPPATLKIGGQFVDIAFPSENELLNPPYPELAVSLAFVKPVRDGGLVLSSGASSAHESLGRNAQKSAEERLTSSVKAMSRAEEALAKSQEEDADFWLASAGYDFAYAWLYASGTLPAPSHLLSQLRQISRGQPGMFEAFSNAVGLQDASRASCDARLEALGIIYDLKDAPGSEQEGAPTTSNRAPYELLTTKSAAVLKSSQPVDAYCFLGLEVARGVPEIVRNRMRQREASDVISSLAGREGGLLATSVVRSLGIKRPPDALEKCLMGLRSQVSTLTRNT